jgi:hypothetical protein
MIVSEETSQIPRKSALEMTLQDHLRIGSTPPDILKQNPGKTKADLMSDEELTDYLITKQDLIEQLSSQENLTNSFAQSALKDTREDFELTKQYLTRIGRMPKIDC